MKINAAFLCPALLALLGTFQARAQEQVMFQYQGYVKVRNEPYNGAGEFKFAIVNTSGHSSLWSNDATSVDGAEPLAAISIPVQDGVFQALIGDPSLGMSPINRVIFNTRNLKLRVWFSDGVHGFQQMQPDNMLHNLELLAIQTDTGDFTIYVNGATGDDENDGLTTPTAKRTISGAADMLPPRIRCNITVDVTDGVYREEISLFGITAEVGKYVTFVGDENWTPASVDPPTVRVTGADVDTTATTPVAARSFGFNVRQCSGIKIKGFLVDYASSAGFHVAEGTCSLEKCKALYNGPGGGIVYTTAAYGSIRDCVANQNQKYGFQVANFSGPTTAGALIANDNGLVGFGVGKLARVSFHDSGDFSNNDQYGVLVSEGSQAAFDYRYNGTINSNGEYGLVVQFDSFTVGHTRNTITGNGLQNIYTVSGGNTYSYSGIDQK